ncbi:MAG: flippase-like domain-containing protein [Candidatus Cloacimonetes bacterium]|nr:flippase-like domain-containing protein [Candidatus Cloacimonadota bacterium]
MKNRKLNWLIGSLIGSIFLGLWIKIVDWKEFLFYLTSFQLEPVLGFSVFYMLAYFFRSLRWRIILKPIYQLNVLDSFSIFILGLLVNFLVPIRAGEFVKALLLKKKYSLQISRSLPTIFIDKLSDLFPILIILIGLPLFTFKMNITLYTVITLILLIFLLLIIFLYLAVNHKQKTVDILNIIFSILPPGFRNKLEYFIDSFVSGMSIMRKRFSAIAGISLLTILAIFAEAFYIFMVFRAFGAQIDYPHILFGYTLMNLTYILPTPPAQIGSNQFMWVLIFSFALGLNENLTSAAVTFSHLLTTIIILLLGGLSLMALKIKPKDLKYSDKKNN